MEINDVTKETEDKKILEKIVEISEEFLQSSALELNYQKITDNIVDISGAKYAGFNLFDEDGSKFRTIAFSAPSGVAKKASSLLKFNLIGKVWEHDPVREEKIKAHTITHFSNLSALAGDFIYRPLALLLEKTFSFGEVVLVKILKENKMIGDFTLIMPRNVKLKNENYINIYTRQVGLLITRNRSEVKLIERERELRNVFKSLSNPLFLFDQETGAILDINDMACSLYGYSRDEMLKLKASDMSSEPEATRASMKNFTAFIPVRHHKKKDGTVFTVEVTASLFKLSGRNVITASMRDITERKRHEEALEESKKNAERYLNIAAEIILSLDTSGNITLLNESGHKLLGYNHNELIGKNWFKTCLPKEAESEVSGVFKKLIKGEIGNVLNHENAVKTKNGGLKIILWHNTLLKDSDGNITGLMSSGEDITERKESENVLRESEARLRNILDSTPFPVALVDVKDRIIYYWSRSAIKLFGYDAPKTTPEWYQLAYPDPAYRLDVINRWKPFLEKAKLAKKPINTGEYRVTCYDGSVRICELYANYLEDMLVVTFNDVTERKSRENEILHLSYHNKLTGLYNRRFVEEEIMRLDTRRQLPLSIIMGDLNNLKLTNDTFGHIAGDNIIKEAAKLLKKMCRSDDILARWGGDEFVILLPQTSTETSEEIVQRIKKECSKLIINNIPLGLAIGIATKTEEAQDIEMIIVEAESNMYKNKLVEKESSSSSVIFALEQALFEKSAETYEHTIRIKDNALKLGKAIKLVSYQLDELSLLASLHDIGKVAIPEAILLKEGKLTEEEWTAVKRHPEIGFNIAQSSAQIVHIAKYILSCHENWDGSGYPQGLSKETIPIVSRVMTIVDAYDVMTNSRIYKKTMTKNEAIKELRRCSGTQFDPVLVKKFIEIL